MKCISIFLLMTIVACVAFANDQIVQDQGSRPVYDAPNKKGWWWYEEAPKKNKDEDQGVQAKKHFIPDMKNYSEKQLWEMHPDDFQPLLKAFLSKAVQLPDERNVADYYKMQNIARLRAASFANVASLVWQKYPELTLSDDAPTNRPGVIATTRMQTREIETKIAASVNDYALLYFYSNTCEYCQAQDRIIEVFIEKYRWNVRDIELSTNSDLAARFNVTTVPYLLLIYKNSSESIPVAVGVTPLDEMEAKLYKGIRFLAGEITPESFNLYDYQRGGGFDPSANYQRQ